MVARMPADVSKRPTLPALALVLVTAACGAPPIGEVDFGSGRQFVPEIADSIDDVGRGAAVAMNPDGIPFVSYDGFPAELAEGEIAIGRPIGAPFVPGVLLASKQEGVWNRGAVAMSLEPPGQVTIPFGPDTVEPLADATPENTNGTDIAVAPNGDLVAVWAAPDGIWAASGGESFAAELVVPLDPRLRQPGSLGWPSVAVDDDGTPWIAATVSTDIGQEVITATPDGESWDVQTVSEISPCDGCPDPARTGLALGQDGPVVVYADPAAGDVVAARQDGRSWTSETVEAGAQGIGISVASGGDGAIYAAYYAAEDTVSLARSDGGTWSAEEAATVGGGEPEGLGTGIAVTDDGGLYLTYTDPAEGVILTSAADGSAFTPIETRATEGGWWPDVAVTPDGASVSIAWYVSELQDLAFGTYAETGEIVVAAPSPPFAVSTEAAAGGDCEPEGTELEITAVGLAWDKDCLAVDAGADFTVSMDNTDTTAAHNFSIYTEANGEALFASDLDATVTGSVVPYDVPAIDDPGDFLFQCDFHPTSMIGTFIVAEGRN